MKHSSPSFVIDTLESRMLFATQVVGYLPDYEYVSTINKFAWGNLTQLNYFSLQADATTGKLINTGPNAIDLSHLTLTVQLAHQNKVKVEIVVGGAGLDASIPVIGASKAKRLAFAKSVQAFCKTYHIDGVDLDWEPENPTAAEIASYASLIHALKIHTSGLQLSAAVNAEQLPISPTNITSQYVLNVSAITDLDQINVMTYDLSFARHSPTARSEDDLTAWGDYLTDHGVSKQKLLFGLPFYGRAGTSWNTSQAQGYGDIVDAYIGQTGKSPAANADVLKVAFAGQFNNQPVNWFFNSPKTIASKTTFAINNGFGGVMIWNLGLDHYNVLGRTDKFSLLPVIHKAVVAAQV